MLQSKVRQGRLCIALADRSVAACIAAIDSLTARFESDTLVAQFEEKLNFEFVIGRFPCATILDATQFFAMLEDKPESVPALRRMLTAFLAMPYMSVWAESGICLSPALRSLGILDSTAISLIQRYPADTAHNPFIMDRVLPAIVTAHGWTDEIVDLAIDWALLQQLHNEDGGYWRERGLGAAIAKRYKPQAFVQRMQADGGEPDFSSEDAVTLGFAKAIAPFTAWERRMFALIGIAEPPPRQPLMHERCDDDVYMRNEVQRSAAQLRSVGWFAVASGYLLFEISRSAMRGADITELAMVGLSFLAAVSGIAMQSCEMHEHEGTTDETTPMPLWYLHIVLMLGVGAMAAFATDWGFDALRSGVFVPPDFIAEPLRKHVRVIAVGSAVLLSVWGTNRVLANLIGHEGQFSTIAGRVTGRSWM